jgi:hypothetical protein
MLNKNNLEDIEYDEIEKAYFASCKKKVTEFVAEMTAEDPEFVRTARINYLIERWAEYKTKIDVARLRWDLDVKTNVSITDRQFRWHLADTPALQKKMMRYGRELLMLLKGKDFNNGVTEEVIELARNANIEDFVEADKRGFIHCINPEHEDRHPSMCIKNGFAYCFSCGFQCRDVIDFIMKREKLSFPEAVQFIVQNINGTY